MVITYLGGNCFKLTSGDTTIAVNPPAAGSKHKVSKFGSDIVIIPVEHEDWNGVETATHASKEPFVVRGPGAYEIGDVVITGYAAPGAIVGENSDYGNTVYSVQFDGMKLLLLGALASEALPQDARAEVSGVDVVFVPLGGNVLNGKGAHNLTVALEANVLIPHATNGDEDLKEFIKLAGAEGVKAQDKLTLKPKDLADLSGEVVLLKK